MDARTKEQVLTCPRCKNNDPDSISILFPGNDALSQRKPSTLAVAKLRSRIQWSLSNPQDYWAVRIIVVGIPNFFRCGECKTPFRFDKNGREYVPKVSRLSCPQCHFDEVGIINVYSADDRPPLPIRSRGYRKSYFYNDTLFANGFECPRCKTKFFVDENGKEYKC